MSDDRVLGGVALGWFDNDTRELIVADPANNYLPENVDHAHIEGLTFDAQTLPRHGISATLNATDLYLAQDLDAQTRLPNDPVFSVNLGLVYRGSARAWLSEAGISERAVGARGAVDPTQPLFYQPAAYSDLTAYTGFRLAPKLLLTIRGYNLGNERYAEVSGLSDARTHLRGRADREIIVNGWRLPAILALTLLACAASLLAGGSAIAPSAIMRRARASARFATTSRRSYGSCGCRVSRSPPQLVQPSRSAARCFKACCAIRWSIRILPA